MPLPGFPLSVLALLLASGVSPGSSDITPED
jgi:hypothetical protein